MEKSIHFDRIWGFAPLWLLPPGCGWWSSTATPRPFHGLCSKPSEALSETRVVWHEIYSISSDNKKHSLAWARDNERRAASITGLNFSKFISWRSESIPWRSLRPNKQRLQHRNHSTCRDRAMQVQKPKTRWPYTLNSCWWPTSHTPEAAEVSCSRQLCDSVNSSSSKLAGLETRVTITWRRIGG